MIKLFDSHCHFDFSVFDNDRVSIWQACCEQGLNNLLIPGVAPEQWLVMQALADNMAGIWISAGIHPWWVGRTDWPALAHWQKLLEHPRCVAIGECGLDKAIDTPMAEQEQVFKQQLALAVDFDLPIIVHVRQTHNETLRLLKHYQPRRGGVVHGFSGSVELAESYWKMGFRLGIGGSITYPRANKTRKTVMHMPLEALMLETDAPDMPLNGYQGQANSPERLIEVAKTLAELRGEPLEHIAKQTTANSCELFGLSV